MLKVTRPEKARWISEGRHRMMVRSEGPHIEEYLVDLMENWPVGWCGCEDYEYRKFYQKDKPVECRRCKHIKAARAWLGNLYVDEDLKKTKAANLAHKARQRKEKAAQSGIQSRTYYLHP